MISDAKVNNSVRDHLYNLPVGNMESPRGKSLGQLLIESKQSMKLYIVLLISQWAHIAVDAPTLGVRVVIVRYMCAASGAQH